MNLVLDILFYFGILINISILIIIFKNKIDVFHQKILFFIFLSILLSQICTLGFFKKNKYLFYPTFIFNNAISVYIGPLILLYVKSIFLPAKKLFLKNIKHFIVPIFYFLIITVPFLISMLKKDFIFKYLEVVDDYIDFSILYSLFYCLLSIKVLNSAQEVIVQNYSNLDTVDLKWIKKLLIGAVFVIVLDLFTTGYELIFDDFFLSSGGFLTNIGIVFLVGYLAYNGISQSKIFLPVYLLKKHNLIFEKESMVYNEKEKVKTTAYNDDEMLVLKEKLQKLMKEEQPFLNPDVSLKTLATLLSIPERKMSTLLNQYLNISFYDYINTYRVEAFKENLQSPSNENYTLLSIAYGCGFSSKTSFNRVFHKIAKMSPSAYKKTLNV